MDANRRHGRHGARGGRDAWHPGAAVLPEATADDVRHADWLADSPGVAGPDGTIAFRVQAFVLQRAGRIVLVDPCVGNGKRRSLPC